MTKTVKIEMEDELVEHLDEVRGEKSRAALIKEILINEFKDQGDPNEIDELKDMIGSLNEKILDLEKRLDTNNITGDETKPAGELEERGEYHKSYEQRDEWIPLGKDEESESRVQERPEETISFSRSILRFPNDTIETDEEEIYGEEEEYYQDIELSPTKVDYRDKDPEEYTYLKYRENSLDPNYDPTKKVARPPEEDGEEKGKIQEETGAISQDMDVEESCPICGNQISYIPAYDKYYCYQCERYMNVPRSSGEYVSTHEKGKGFLERFLYGP